MVILATFEVLDSHTYLVATASENILVEHFHHQRKCFCTARLWRLNRDSLEWNFYALLGSRKIVILHSTLVTPFYSHFLICHHLELVLDKKFRFPLFLSSHSLNYSQYTIPPNSLNLQFIGPFIFSLSINTLKMFNKNIIKYDDYTDNTYLVYTFSYLKEVLVIVW